MNAEGISYRCDTRCESCQLDTVFCARQLLGLFDQLWQDGVREGGGSRDGHGRVVERRGCRGRPRVVVTLSSEEKACAATIEMRDMNIAQCETPIARMRIEAHEGGRYEKATRHVCHAVDI